MMGEVMQYKRKPFLLFILTFLCIGLSGCGEKKQALQDGYYIAEMAEYHLGWKEFVSLCVSNGQLVSVEYNARNASGFIKSWDMNYMRKMESITGAYPNMYTRNYAAQFLEKQDTNTIDAISGASSSWGSFKQLADAALQQAKKGDCSVTIVTIE